WANRKYFKLRPDGSQSFVAGVPPDYFSKTGQLWGNPLYNWEEHEKNGYIWWVERITNLLRSVDIVRIDHFRGFEACWEVPADEKTAINGSWVDSAGWELFRKLGKVFGEDIPIIAEDLGIITEEVEDLRDAFDLPGMKIFEFCPWNDLEELAEAPYLPVNYIENCVAYTGTHDNQPLIGWFKQLPDYEKTNVLNYLGLPEESDDLHWKVIENIMNSQAGMVVFPIQDILGLGDESRFNTPGTMGTSNWSWRIKKEMLTDEVSKRLRKMVKTSQR
ncbi:4-alpha-glucanotransferase, partial [bacterium]|nr:4-alpha-glucanotransferase [bacterium]